jgi:hypothetical protein
VSWNFTYAVAVSGTTGTSGTIVPFSFKQDASATGRSLTLVQVSFSLGGTAVAAALPASLGVYSSASSGGGTVTPGKFSNQSIGAPTTSCRTLDTTPGAVVSLLTAWQVQPLGGLIDVEYPLDREPGMDAVTSDYIGLQVINQGTSYPFSAYAIFEEK